MAIGTIIRRRREQLKLTQDQVSERAGISKPYLSNIETGRAKNPPSDGVLKALEGVLGFAQGELVATAHIERTPRDVRDAHRGLQDEVHRLQGLIKELAEGRGPSPAELAAELQRAGGAGNVRAIAADARVPIINNVAAGYPQHFTDLDYPPSVADDYIRCPDVHDAQAFAARVVGDSMEPTYREGDVVIFSPSTAIRNGDDCFVRFEGDGGTTFKRMYQDEPSSIRLQPLNSRYPSQVYPSQQITGLWPAVYRMERIR